MQFTARSMNDSTNDASKLANKANAGPESVSILGLRDSDLSTLLTVKDTSRNG